MTCLYATLGVSRRADEAEIRRAFRTMAKACHPDLNAGSREAERRFKEVGGAYLTLRDREARAAYDLASSTAARRRLRGAAATMSTSFALTVCCGLLLAVCVQGSALVWPHAKLPQGAPLTSVTEMQFAGVPIVLR